MPRAFKRERSPLGSMLIRLRKEHGDVSQEELARRTREVAERPVSSSHIAQIETGNRGASYQTLLTLADALRLTGDDYDDFLRTGGVEPGVPDEEATEIRAVTDDLGAKLDELNRLPALATAATDRLEALEALHQEATLALRQIALRVVEITDRYDAEKERQRRRRRPSAEAPPAP